MEILWHDQLMRPIYGKTVAISVEEANLWKDCGMIS